MTPISFATMSPSDLDTVKPGKTRPLTKTRKHGSPESWKQTPPKFEIRSDSSRLDATCCVLIVATEHLVRSGLGSGVVSLYRTRGGSELLGMSNFPAASPQFANTIWSLTTTPTIAQHPELVASMNAALSSGVGTNHFLVVRFTWASSDATMAPCADSNICTIICFTCSTELGVSLAISSLNTSKCISNCLATLLAAKFAIWPPLLPCPSITPKINPRDNRTAKLAWLGGVPGLVHLDGRQSCPRPSSAGDNLPRVYSPGPCVPEIETYWISDLVSARTCATDAAIVS
mmetsp:Transcript_22352/g.48796  ORF Transcript_22352/g.48796 Transcript_22352/m.48796 type:complete len:288 (-) Transcript_22352:105-968(-)